MKKSEIIRKIIDGIMYAHMAIPCIGLIVIFILMFIDMAYSAVFGFLFCGAYIIEVVIALQLMSSLESLRDKMKENEEI